MTPLLKYINKYMLFSVAANAMSGCNGVAVSLVPPGARFLADAIRRGGSGSISGVAHAFSRQRGLSKKRKKYAMSAK